MTFLQTGIALFGKLRQAVYFLSNNRSAWLHRVLRVFSTTPSAAPTGSAPAAPPAPPAPERTVFGDLKDEDRIFTNIYGRHDPFMKVC